MHSTTWHQDPATAPAGVAVFIQDIAIRRYAEHGDNIMRRSEFERGGRFTGLGAPDLVVQDVREFFRELKDAAGTA